jgi:hypothetical protein
MTSLIDGLTAGRAASPAYAGDSTDLIGAFFDAMLQPALRRERASRLLQVYRDADALAPLGQALTRHLGRLHAAAERPSPDNLETWASVWETAAQGLDTFRLSLRIFRTGIDFLKAGEPTLAYSWISTRRSAGCWNRCSIWIPRSDQGREA